MRIGVDARAAAEEKGGRGTVVRELLRAWARADGSHDFVLYAREPWDEPLDERFSWRLIHARDPFWHLRTAVSANRECDVFLSTNSYLTTWFLRIPAVAMVMDMVAFDRELLPQRRAGLIERATLPVAVRRAQGFACISQSTADDLAARFPRAGRSVAVVPLAADERFRPSGPRTTLVDGPYVLGVGTLEPRKNLPRLVKAFARLPDEVRGGRVLALAGAIGWETGETMDTLTRHAGLVRALGYVPDDELAALYRGADLFAYPSLYEGFGLPVLEAMASGAPVLTSRVSSLPEVAGDAAFYVDPVDTGDIARVLGEALGDDQRRHELGGRGLERSQRFSWESTANATLALLERAAIRLS